MSENNEVENVKVLIVGSGPAGYTAAIYAARAGLNPVLYTGAEPGGQLMITTDVENYPGYPNGVLGPQMMQDFEQQAKNVGTDVRYGTITKVDFSNNAHRVWVDDAKEIKADAVILSTGASAKWLGIPSETRLNGSGVSACAVCDGFFFKGKKVAVVGGGDTACEEALYLANLCPEVHVLVRRDEMRASQIMQNRVLKAKNITIHWNTETKEILGDEAVTGVHVFNNVTNEEKIIEVEGFFVAIGHKPNSDFLKGHLDMNENGYVITQAGTTKTKVPGVFAAGDLQDFTYRQAVTAAGTGCMAALDAERYLGELEV